MLAFAAATSVVAQPVNSPRGAAMSATYKLEYVDAGGHHGALTLLAIDVADDLAVVRLDRTTELFFEFDRRAVEGLLPQGERLFSLGNPLDLGFTIAFA